MFLPTTRRCDFPLPRDYNISPCHFLWAGSVSMMPRPRFNLFSTPPRAAMDYFPFVVFSFPPGGLPLPVKHRARACVCRMRACERWPCALVRERSCNNNKKRATLWGTNGLRPVHPMLGGAGLILYPQWLSFCGAAFYRNVSYWVTRRKKFKDIWNEDKVRLYFYRNIFGQYFLLFMGDCDYTIKFVYTNNMITIRYLKLKFLERLLIVDVSGKR